MLPECPCNFTEFPPLGGAILQGFSQEAQALQSALLTSVPDTAFSQICQSNCCACESEAHASYSNLQKNRTFTIAGSISVIEQLQVQESGQASENSEGRSEKDTTCQTNNAQGGLGASAQCVNVTLCPIQGALSTEAAA